MKPVDYWLLLHPFLAITILFPLLGAVVRLALQVRRRRLNPTDTAGHAGSPGAAHYRLGRWLASSVTLLALLGIGFAITSKAVEKGLLAFGGVGRVALLALIATSTLVALAWCLRATVRWQRWAAAAVAVGGILFLGQQPEVFRRSYEWWVSHYWIGMAVVALLLASAASAPDVWRHLLWRRLHVAANLFVLVLLVLMAATGVRDLLEIPLSWQAAMLSRCDWAKMVCP